MAKKDTKKDKGEKKAKPEKLVLPDVFRDLQVLNDDADLATARVSDDGLSIILTPRQGLGTGVVSLVGEDKNKPLAVIDFTFGEAKRKKKDRLPTPAGYESGAMLSQDLLTASATLGNAEARFITDMYYVFQKNRIRFTHQIRQLDLSGEPNQFISWTHQETSDLESKLKKALDAYSLSQPIGRWAQSIVGIGPVTAAGLMAHCQPGLDNFQTAGKIWRYAGLDPSVRWEKGQKRPWNASLKRLCFIIGESFTKFQAHPRDFYGRGFRERRAFEIKRNDDGSRIEQARASLELKNYRESTDAWAWYSGCYPAGTCVQWNMLERDARRTHPANSAKRAAWLNAARLDLLASAKVEPGQGLPMLPPARILLRAQRWATKLFLSHWQHVAYELATGEPPPHPYIISRPPIAGEGPHTLIKPINWPMDPNFNPAGEAKAFQPSLDALVIDEETPEWYNTYGKESDGTLPEVY